MVDELVCYCFGHSRADIVQDVEQHGRSTILERIMAEKSKGDCQCQTKNPKGR